MKQKPMKPGHLKENPVTLTQTKTTKRALSRVARQNYNLKKLQPVQLNWGKKQ